MNEKICLKMLDRYLYERAFKSHGGISGTGFRKFIAEAVSPTEVHFLPFSSMH